MPSPNKIKDYLRIILKYKLLILAISIGAMLYTGLPDLYKKPVYESKTSLLFKGERPAEDEGQFNIDRFRLDPRMTNHSFLLIVRSRTVAEMVFKDLNLRERIPGWNNPNIPTQELVTAVQNMVHYELSPLFKIKVAGEDPLILADVANGFVAAGLRCWRKENCAEVTEKREYLEKQIPLIEKKLRTIEDRLKNYSLLSPDDFTAASLEMNKLKREFGLINNIYLTLRKEYEAARLDDLKEAAPFIVIDRAVWPSKPVSVAPWFSFLPGLFFGFLGASLAAVAFESLAGFWNAQSKS